MQSGEVLVVGATGKTGRRVAERLGELGYEPRAASRRGPVHFDWGDESSWLPAIGRSHAAYLIDSQGADAADRLASFSAIAVGRGVRRLVLLSARDWATSGSRESLATERALIDSGAEWTILRPSWFAQNFSETPFLHGPVLDGEVALPTGDGLEPFIHADDIADVATAALTERGHAGQTYELSGPRCLSFGRAVEEIAHATGRDIAFVDVSDAEYLARAVDKGVERELAAALAVLFGWIREGRNAHLSDGVQRVLDREPLDFATYVTETASTDAWKVLS